MGASGDKTRCWASKQAGAGQTCRRTPQCKKTAHVTSPSSKAIRRLSSRQSAHAQLQCVLRTLRSQGAALLKWGHTLIAVRLVREPESPPTDPQKLVEQAAMRPHVQAPGQQAGQHCHRSSSARWALRPAGGLSIAPRSKHRTCPKNIALMPGRDGRTARPASCGLREVCTLQRIGFEAADQADASC